GQTCALPISDYSRAPGESAARVPLTLTQRILAQTLSTNPLHHGQIQTRIHLARRLYATRKSAQQNADQGICQDSQAGGIAQLGFRWQLDAAGGRQEFR